MSNRNYKHQFFDLDLAGTRGQRSMMPDGRIYLSFLLNGTEKAHVDVTSRGQVSIFAEPDFLLDLAAAIYAALAEKSRLDRELTDEPVTDGHGMEALFPPPETVLISDAEIAAARKEADAAFVVLGGEA